MSAHPNPAGIGIIAVEAELPATVRRARDDDRPDPAASSASTEEDRLFEAAPHAERRVLDEPLDDLMTRACLRLLQRTGTTPDEIGLLIGTESPGRYHVPNGLQALPQRLGLPRTACWPIPIAGDFSVFCTSFLLAKAVIADPAGWCRKALGAVGSGWSVCVDPARRHAEVVGDGAAAFLVGAGRAVELMFVDAEIALADDEFASIVLHHAGPSGRPRFEIAADRGIAAFRTTGMNLPVAVARTLLRRNGVAPRQACVIAHQATRTLSRYWAAQIDAGEFPDTFDTVGNATSASVLITLARHWDFNSRWLLVLTLGLGNHVAALLFRRAHA